MTNTVAILWLELKLYWIVFKIEQYGFKYYGQDGDAETINST